MQLPAAPTDIAPDGSRVRPLLRLSGGSLAHFELPPGQTSKPVAHRTVEEIWFVLSGRGEMWRKQGDREETIHVAPGLCLTIPLGTHFQFRCLGEQALKILIITMPPWPGATEAYAVKGPWDPAP